MQRWSCLSILMSVPLCCAAAGVADEKREHVTTTDQRVILAALEDFSQRQGLMREDGATVPVNDETRAWSSYTAGQITGDLKNEGWSASQELLDATAKRNAAAVPLHQLRLGKTFPVTDVDKLRDHYGGIMNLLDKVPAVVYLSLPGYSRDAKTALLRFFFAPSAHGAAATYLLVKEGAGWHVKHKTISYYA